ncbi:MAG: phosphotransferase, partial [Desulfobacterales bacterium]|nr:phosphotransferase [Desulfobacterales bacterium]
EQQSGLDNQIEYEFQALKFLEGYGIAPKAFLFDDTCRLFKFAVLVEEFLEGRHLTLEWEDVFSVAELLAKLHELDPWGQPFITWDNPLQNTYSFVRNDITSYAAKKSHCQTTLSLAQRLYDKMGPSVRDCGPLFRPDSLNHTDLSLDNFIFSGKGLRLIDWEKPRVDDASYDLCCFLSAPAELWCSQRTLDADARTAFIEAYARLSGKNSKALKEKVRIREPLVSLHWILWGATKLCDLNERSTTPELVQAHREKTIRYERIAKPENIEILLESTG